MSAKSASIGRARIEEQLNCSRYGTTVLYVAV